MFSTLEALNYKTEELKKAIDEDNEEKSIEILYAILKQFETERLQ